VDDVQLTSRVEGKLLRFRGDLMFTHWGIGGPAVLHLCWRLAGLFGPGFKGVEVVMDFFPDEEPSHIDRRLRALIDEHPRRKPAALVGRMGLPGVAAEVLCREYLVAVDCPGAQLSRAERNKVVGLLKGLTLKVTGPRPPAHAVAVRGGVSREEIDGQTMESRIVPGLFFAGEVIDVDGDCGGYNLQIAWSTGRLAGMSAGRS